MKDYPQRLFDRKEGGKDDRGILLMSRLDITQGPYKSVRIRSSTKGGSGLQGTLVAVQSETLGLGDLLWNL